MAGADRSRGPVWFKSSYSNGAGGECVECAWKADEALVRDSKRDTGPVVAFGVGAWQAFLAGVGPAWSAPSRDAENRTMTTP
jgi:hypothetical protein